MLFFDHLRFVMLSCLLGPAILAATSAVAAPGDPTAVPATRAEVEETVAALWSKGRFADLEALDLSLSSNAKLTRSGYWLRDLLSQAMLSQFESESQTVEGWTRLSAKVKKWTAASPTSPLARIAQADVHTVRAWAIRGEDLAYTVSKAQWAGFYSNLAKAKAELVQYKQVMHGHPFWYQRMARITQWTNPRSNDFDRIVEAGLAENPSSFMLVAAAIDRSSRKWGGAPGDVGKVVSVLVQKLPSEMRNDVYARAFGYAVNAFGTETALEFDCSRAIDGFKVVVARFPTPFNIHQGARASYECRDRESARTAFRMATEPLPNGSWGTGEEARMRFLDWRAWRDAP